VFLIFKNLKIEFQVLLLSIILLAVGLFAISIGSVPISFVAIIKEFLNSLPGVSINSDLDQVEKTIISEVRAPRIVLAGLVGASLSLSGASYQGVFKNDLADPYLLGVASGAGLGATISIIYNLGSSVSGISLTTVLAFIGAILAVSISVFAARLAGRDSSYLLLTGIAVAAFFTALQTFLLQMNRESISQVYLWILGGLSTNGWSEVQLLLPYVIICAVPIFLLRRSLDVLRLGDAEAKSVGMQPNKVRMVVVCFATLLTAAAVSVSGLIAFVGLIVPHIVRRIFGSSYRYLLILSTISGAIFLILADVVSRNIVQSQIPIGVVTAAVGGPFFLVVLIQSKAKNVST